MSNTVDLVLESFAYKQNVNNAVFGSEKIHAKRIPEKKYLDTNLIQIFTF